MTQAQRQNIYVFVECGAKAQIEMMHYSIKALRKYSSLEIVVITDSLRNEIPVVHSTVVDVETPAEFSHHQASIFLKTGAHKFLPSGNNYCYLDSDVIALSKQADEIFNNYVPPVTFCTDITRLNRFSRFAVNCDCFENFERDKVLPAFYEEEYTNTILPQLEFIDRAIREIEVRVKATKESTWKYRWHKIKYFLGGRFYHLDSDYKLEKKTGNWYTRSGKLLKYENQDKDVVVFIHNKTGLNFNSSTQQWNRHDGTSVSELYCNHLKEAVKRKFNQSISPDDWQHWNGGVFLFNEESCQFLDYWHDITLQIFQDKEWAVRDQGTLAATVWKFGLQNHYTLPMAYNFIVSSVMLHSSYAGNLQFESIPSGKIVTPCLLHVYKNWGDSNWNVWQDITRHIASNE